MQHSAAAILLHRPLACFGSTAPQSRQASEVSREICVRHACLIAQRLRDYEKAHGSALTMSWIALHMIATAATTLVANLSDHGADPSASKQLSSLQACIKALNELEKSHLPTRRVRRVIQHAMRTIDLTEKVENAMPLDSNEEELYGLITLSQPTPELEVYEGLGSAAMLMTDLSMDFSAPLFSCDEFLPAGAPTSMLQSFETYLF